MQGVRRAQERVDSSYFWPLRLLEGARERMSNWAAGMFNLFRRRSNSLETLYRPHKSQLTKPYAQRRNDQQSSSSSRVNTRTKTKTKTMTKTIAQEKNYFGENNWKPVTNPELTARVGKVVDRVNVTNTNYWKALPNFVTSSGTKLKTYFWRHFPRILSRSSDGQ